MIEVSALHQAGYQQVLLVDFDGIVPDYYLPWLPEQRVNFPYAVALLLRRATSCTALAVLAEMRGQKQGYRRACAFCSSGWRNRPPSACRANA